jgi:hypothetical protein
MLGNKKIFIAWIPFQRRAVSMQPFFNYDLRFIKSPFKNKWLKPFDYLIKTIRTIVILIQKKPEIVWIQLPPTPLLHILLLYKKTLNRHLVLVMDCHNGVFWGKWRKYLSKDKLNKGDIIIVHNSVIKEIAVDLGINVNKIVVLETRPATKNTEYIRKKEVLTERPRVLMPCSFNIDEPLNVVFEAARHIPEVDILISGPFEKGAKLFDFSKIPDNVKLLGYLPRDEYEFTFNQVEVVLGLTTEDHIQLSVANEAVGFEIPMVISDTKLLRELFNKGAIYVETLNSHSIADGIIKALDKCVTLKEEVNVLHKERIVRWETMAKSVDEKVMNL